MPHHRKDGEPIEVKKLLGPHGHEYAQTHHLYAPNLNSYVSEESRSRQIRMEAARSDEITNPVVDSLVSFAIGASLAAVNGIDALGRTRIATELQSHLRR